MIFEPITGAKIEVKSPAYLQSWKQTKLSTVRFDIARKQAWDAEKNVSSKLPIRHSDTYVFCVLAETDAELVDPLSLDQWQFFVVSTNLIDSRLENQKSLTLSNLKNIAGLGISHNELAAAVRANYKR